MRKILYLAAAVALLTGMFCGCTIHITIGETGPAATEPPLESTPPSRTTEQTEPPAPSTEPFIQTIPTQPPVQTNGMGLYLVTVTAPGHPIYSGPDYYSTYIGTVHQAGIYTILEEAWDVAGNRWGRLKSGMGWIDVTGLDREPLVPITADYADEYLLQNGYYHSWAGEQSEYSVAAVFRAREKLQNLCLYSMRLEDWGYGMDQLVGYRQELAMDVPLVAWLSFPGDLSAYGITFTDANGVARSYLITVSGMDGSLELSEYSLG